MDVFKPADFKVFDIPGFHERMGSIMLRIRPKLTSLGDSLVSEASALVDRPLHVHVAKHARRTVNPPDDTWAAFGPDERGYKKDVHFKAAVSRNCVRFLFEVGPEYYAKTDWVRNWHRDFRDISKALKGSGLDWFKDEHDEEPAATLAGLSPADLEALAESLTRRKDGQFVLGRRIDAAQFTRMSDAAIRSVAREVFKPAARLFCLNAFRKN